MLCKMSRKFRWKYLEKFTSADLFFALRSSALGASATSFLTSASDIVCVGWRWSRGRREVLLAGVVFN